MQIVTNVSGDFVLFLTMFSHSQGILILPFLVFSFIVPGFLPFTDTQNLLPTSISSLAPSLFLLQNLKVPVLLL